MTKKDIEEIQKLPPQDRHFNLDLSFNTETGKKLEQEFSMTVPVAARGSVVLETTDLDKPIEVKVFAKENDDFRLLVRDSSAKMSYVMNNDNTVSVLANDKPVALLNYQQSGTALQKKDVVIETVDAQGNTKAIDGLSPSEAILAKIGKQADANKDGKVTQEEMGTYIAKMDNVQSALSGSEKVVIRGENLVQSKYENGASKITPAPVGLKENIIALTEGETTSNGVLVRKDDIAEFKERKSMLDMLKDSGFVKPEGVQVAHFASMGEQLAPSGTPAPGQSAGKGASR